MRKQAEVLGEKPVPFTPCPLKISHGVEWDQTHASAMTAQQLTALAMVWPDRFKFIKMILQHSITTSQ
jgi:hypothetical protein